MELLEEAGEGATVHRTRLESGELFKVLEQRQLHAVAHVCDLQLRENATEVLDRTHTAGAAVRDKRGRLVVQLTRDEREAVGERGRRAMVVLGRDEQKRVEGVQLVRPRLCVVFRILLIKVFFFSILSSLQN
jgi:hypothetical protein